MLTNNLKDFLDEHVERFNRPDFIADDPICIPHRFSTTQDIEIMGFFAAILAWGQRKTIINKCTELIERMDYAPYDFVRNHQDTDLIKLLHFKHRTFNDTDLLYFVSFFKRHYALFDSLEDAFIPRVKPAAYREEYLQENNNTFPTYASPSCLLHETAQPNLQMEQVLNFFKGYFFSDIDYPQRTLKHISSPRSKSACKRINMFLRWMVRKDNKGVDFGIWNRIKPSALICPFDVHVERVARRLKLINRPKADWMTAVELTEKLQSFDSKDPVKYDFALFGLGVIGEL